MRISRALQTENIITGIEREIAEDNETIIHDHLQDEGLSDFCFVPGFGYLDKSK